MVCGLFRSEYTSFPTDDDIGLGNSSRRNKASGATERDGDAGSAGGDVSRQESVSSATSGAAGKEDGSNDGASAASEEKRQELIEAQEEYQEELEEAYED